MNFTQDWLSFLRSDLTKIGIEVPTMPDELLPQYYLAILSKIRSAAAQGIQLSALQLRTIDEPQELIAADQLAQKCLLEIAANQNYIREHEAEIRKLLLKQCPELVEEDHRIYLSWSSWDECEMVFEFVKSRIGLREKLKLRCHENF